MPLPEVCQGVTHPSAFRLTPAQDDWIDSRLQIQWFVDALFLIRMWW